MREVETIPQLKEAYRARERELYLAALERHGWNASRAAVELGVTPNAVQKAIERFGWRATYEERSPGRGQPRG